MPTDLSRLLPLKPVEFLLLLALVEHEQHGYALAKEIAQRTNGVVRLEPGNLYRVIKRLLDERLVEVSKRRPAPELDDERRRYYKIAPRGAQLAAMEAERLRTLLDSAPVRALAPLMAHA
jgi:DNA-binding PadR family transcriptional regulator